MTVKNTKTVRDKRGFLIEYLKKEDLKEVGTDFGLTYVASILPGNFRGNHYHKKKTEFVSCVYGKVKATLFDISTKEKKEFMLNSSDKEIKRLIVKPGIAHLFENNFDETAVLVAHASENSYDQGDDYRYIIK